MRVNVTKLAAGIGGLCVCLLGATLVIQTLNYAKIRHAGEVAAQEASARQQQQEKPRLIRVEIETEPLGFQISHPPILLDSDQK
ncbi:hypothetical protein [Cohnella rhizosphaerae]|uniref:Uncharacterized protein n=1 Tax=Cohnella rhizosphaerae TaxID=1457232 RepID=A0A9X4KT99_9BACL|nr:hypothetical protein [Cohnella rhizosphaerae]MDG0810570.1 hypothetical protein [Cohnella rhizosphaerae]